MASLADYPADRHAIVSAIEALGDLLPDVLLGFSEQAADEGDADSWRTLAMRLWTRRAYAELGLEEAG